MDVRIGQFQMILRCLGRLQELFQANSPLKIEPEAEQIEMGVVPECTEHEEGAIREEEVSPQEPEAIVEEKGENEIEIEVTDKGKAGETEGVEEVKVIKTEGGEIGVKEGEEAEEGTCEGVKPEGEVGEKVEAVGRETKEIQEVKAEEEKEAESGPSPIEEETSEPVEPSPPQAASTPEKPSKAAVAPMTPASKTAYIASLRARLQNQRKPLSAAEEEHQILTKLRNLNVLTLLYERQKKKRPRIVEMMTKYRHPLMARRVAVRVAAKLKTLQEAKLLMSHKSWRTNSRNSFYKILDVRSSALQNTGRALLTTKSFALGLAESEKRSRERRVEKECFWKDEMRCPVLEKETSPQRSEGSEGAKSEHQIYESIVKRGSVVLDIGVFKGESEGVKIQEEGGEKGGLIEEKSECESHEEVPPIAEVFKAQQIIASQNARGKKRE